MVRQSSPVQKAHKKKAQTGTRSSRSRVSSHAAASKVPPNDFILFRRDYFPKYPWMPFIERNVHLGKVWAELPREERLHYAELAAEARREHEKLNPIVKVAPKYSKGKKACQPKASAVASDAQQQSGVQHCSPSTPISPLSPTMPTSSQLPTSSEGAVDTNQLLESALSQLSINPLEAMYDHAQPGYAQMYPDGYDWATSQFGADFPLFQADPSMVSCGLSTPLNIPAMTTAVGYASTSQGTSSMASPTLHMPIPRYPAPQGVPQYDSHETEHRSKLAEFLEPSPSNRSVIDLLRPEWVEHYWREYIAGRLDYQLVCGYMERPYSLNPEDIWNGLANMLLHGVLPPVADATQYW